MLRFRLSLRRLGPYAGGRYTCHSMDNRIRHMKSRAFLIVTFLLLIRPGFGQVVINEIFYHAPDDLSDLQWIELLNNSDQPADLSGWRLGKSVQFSFPKGATIAPHGYLVLCKNREQFQQFYSAPVGGQFESAFKKGEGHLELRDATGHIVDAVDFTDRAPWPRGAAGHTASLERICPAAPGNVPENWTDSPLSDDDTKPGGSPAAQNSAFSAKLPPIVSNVTFRPARAQADEPIEVQAHISSPVPIQEVNVLYRLVEPGTESEEKAVPMKAAGADGQYSAIDSGTEGRTNCPLSRSSDGFEFGAAALPQPDRFASGAFLPGSRRRPKKQDPDWSGHSSGCGRGCEFKTAAAERRHAV